MKFILLSLLVVFTFAKAQGEEPRDLKTEILVLTNELKDLTYRGDLTQDQLLGIRDGLRSLLAGTYDPEEPTQVICTKLSNGLFYLTKAKDGSTLGSSSYAAGYSDFQSCHNDLPARGAVLVCLKTSNMLFYPSSVETGAIVGSQSYNSGYSTSSECKETLPARGSKVSCMKEANGLFYPANAITGEVIGSQAYSAGFSDLKSCKDVISQ